MVTYDYLVVGAGLYGCTCARLLTDKGYKCLIIDKRDTIGGNCYTKTIENIDVHWYGPHIFHTNNKDIWDFVNKFSEFNNFTLNTLAYNNDKFYHLPFNLTTMYELFGCKTPIEAKNIVNKEISDYKKDNKEINNLKDQACSSVGTTIFKTLIEGYTEKQWGKKCNKLPANIIKRLPIRYYYNNNYFNDKYQGIPVSGYTKLIKNMISDIDIELNCNYLDNKKYYNNLANYIIYTGPIDEFFKYKYEPLEWRSLEFKHTIQDINNSQGTVIINYTNKDIPYTRTVEHNFFNYKETNTTIITYEYPKKWNLGDECYYPINDKKNTIKLSNYILEAKKYDNIHFGGRLGDYKYYDMDDTIENAIKFCNTIKCKTNEI